MKNIFLIIIFLFSSLSIFSQESENGEIKTILGNVKVTKITAFGGPVMNFTLIDNNFAFMLGGGGGCLLNDHFFFGGYGMGLVNKIYAKQNISDHENSNTDIYKNMKLDYGSGGIWLGYIFLGKSPIHPLIHTQIGWGNINITDLNDLKTIYYSDNIFIINPTIEADLNITRFFRIGIGANYRLTLGVNKLLGYNNNNFSGPGGFLTFKFGYF